jgi:hypothetical protein
VKRTDPLEAEALLRAAGATPLVPFPGRKDLPWRSVHDVCGTEIHPRLSNVRPGRSVCGRCGNMARGARRKAGHADAAVAKMRAAGWEPLTQYPGAGERWLARHIACGTVRESTLNAVRLKGSCEVCWRRRECHTVWDEESANAFMRSAGLTPLDAWPGG